MSLDKAIEHKKEHRKPYKGAKLVDVFCRNHKRIEQAKSKENAEKEVEWKQERIKI